MGSCDFLTALWLSEDIARRNNLSDDESFRIFCSLRCGVPLPGASSQKKKPKVSELKEPSYYREKYKNENLEFRPGDGHGLSFWKAWVYVNGKWIGICNWDPNKDKA